MKVQFRAIRRYGIKNAVVHASVDGIKVLWDPRGWMCAQCPDEHTCPHVDAVYELLDPIVFGDWH